MKLVPEIAIVLSMKQMNHFMGDHILQRIDGKLYGASADQYLALRRVSV